MTTVDARAVMRAVRDRDPSERIRLLQTIKPRLPEQYVPHVPHPTQQLFLLQNGREVLFGGGGGGGKALWVHIYIPTPTGWTTMGAIRAGDEVLGTDGRPCRVLAVSGVMYDHDCYEVTFSDGSTLIADAGHMWTVVDDAGEQSTITTREVRNHVKELSVPAVTARGVVYPPRRITSVTPRVSVPVQCITVDSHDHLFLAGRSMIPTHNSDALLMAALQWVDVPGYSALLLRRTWPDLSMPGAIMDRAREWLQDTDAEPREGGRVWKFPSGARLSFGYLQHDKDKYNFQSSEHTFVGWDELTQFQESTYTYLFSRVRKPVVPCARCKRPVQKYFADGIATVQWKHTESKTSRCDDPMPNPQSLREYGPAPDGTTLFDIPLRVRAASNPGGVGGAWVRDRFVNPATRVRGAVFIPSLLSDNPSLDQETYRHNLEHLNPVDRERLLNGDWDITEQGDYFQRHWFTFLDDIPRDTRIRWVRYWDLAATEKGDWTAGCLLGLTTEGQWIVADVRRMRGTPYEVERFIAATAATDGTGVAIRMEQEPGSSGVNTIDHYRRRVLVGYDFKPDKKTASKTVRANPVSSAAEAGNIILITGAWNREFLDEITVYPRGSHDDMCLAGDTGIHTPQGMVRLSEVRPGDTVLGRTGWTRVTAAGMTSPAATTVERFGVRATENHPVWTHRGWKPFTQVSNDDKLSICSVSGTDVTVQQCRADFVVGATSGTSMGIHHAHPDGSHVRWKDATTQGSTSRDTATSTTPAIKDMVTHCMSREPSRGPSGWSPWCSTGSLSGGTLIRLAPHIVGITNPAVSGSSKAYKPSTRRYGSSTTGLSRKGTISTTGMVITPTTTSAILNALTRHSIGPSTQSNDQRTQVGRNDWPISPVSDRWPLHGTVHQKDWRGTVNTPPTLGSVRSGTRVEPVYNITTEDHTYYANGVLVHNCDSLTGAFSMLARTKGRLLV